MPTDDPSAPGSPRANSSATPSAATGEAELDALFTQLRAEAPPAYVASVALGLPVRVRTRLREAEQAQTVAYQVWLRLSAPLAGACAVYAILRVQDLRAHAFGDPFLASWIFSFFG